MCLRQTPAEFRYKLHLEAKPEAASLHVLVRGEFTARVNGTVRGHHEEWGAFDREELAFVAACGDNEIELKVKSHDDGVGYGDCAGCGGGVDSCDAGEGKEERMVSDERWQARAGVEWGVGGGCDGGADVGGVCVGDGSAERGEGPDRVSTDASLLRKDFEVASGVRSARLSITALGAYEAFVDGKRVAPGHDVDSGVDGLS
jgi:alpha-L-rhamnosidase